MLKNGRFLEIPDFVYKFEFHFNLLMLTLVFPFMQSISVFSRASIEIYLESKESQKNLFVSSNIK